MKRAGTRNIFFFFTWRKRVGSFTSPTNHFFNTEDAGDGAYGL